MIKHNKCKRFEINIKSLISTCTNIRMIFKLQKQPDFFQFAIYLHLPSRLPSPSSPYHLIQSKEYGEKIRRTCSGNWPWHNILLCCSIARAALSSGHHPQRSRQQNNTFFYCFHGQTKVDWWCCQESGCRQFNEHYIR